MQENYYFYSYFFLNVMFGKNLNFQVHKKFVRIVARILTTKMLLTFMVNSWNRQENGFSQEGGILGKGNSNFLFQSISFWPDRTLWRYGLWSFQTGGTNLERFLPKNHHTQENDWILRIGLMGASEVFKIRVIKSIIFIFSGKKYLKLRSCLSSNAIIVF